MSIRTNDSRAKIREWVDMDYSHDEIDKLVTDAGIPREAADALKHHNIVVRIAGE